MKAKEQSTFEFQNDSHSKKSLVFDTGPIITLAMNNLLWILRPLKEKFQGDFYITSGVRRECVERPLASKKFKFEALEILDLIEEGIIKEYDDPKLKDNSLELLTVTNSLFKARGKYIRNVQYAEVEAISAAKMLSADAVVIDEFITRTIFESPELVKKRMERKLNVRVDQDKNNLLLLKKETKWLRIIRSFELVTIAYELGLFEKFYPKTLSNPKKTLLEGLLWATKLNGCSVTEKEISEVMKIENF